MEEEPCKQEICKMKIKKGEWGVIIFSLAYILAFLFYYLSIKNYEFLWYVAVLVFFFVLVLATIRKSNFDYFILWGLSLWGLMHMAGGGLIFNGSVLYRFVIPLFEVGGEAVLRFDQFVHFFGFAVATIVGHHLLKPYLNKKVNWKVVYPLLVFMGMGAGALNEIVEFVAVVTFPETGVGGYINTSLDLVFNSIGAITGAVIIYFRRKNGKSEKGR